MAPERVVRYPAWRTRAPDSALARPCCFLCFLKDQEPYGLAQEPPGLLQEPNRSAQEPPEFLQAPRRLTQESHRSVQETLASVQEACRSDQELRESRQEAQKLRQEPRGPDQETRGTFQEDCLPRQEAQRFVQGLWRDLQERPGLLQEALRASSKHRKGRVSARPDELQLRARHTAPKRTTCSSRPRPARSPRFPRSRSALRSCRPRSWRESGWRCSPGSALS